MLICPFDTTFIKGPTTSHLLRTSRLCSTCVMLLVRSKTGARSHNELPTLVQKCKRQFHPMNTCQLHSWCPCQSPCEVTHVGQALAPCPGEMDETPSEVEMVEDEGGQDGLWR
eukprot:TRINITY_DN12004_c1_g4_i2.p1 TRINITY_DN12004_c1_g4~~TRINITY_DN12004_c1_g4_i2.p1  ORF type:complete len:113 (+),score=12.13 TRINITY_DN12004_c1_g4_i2:325-663(+)